jgi:elongation factor Ts
MYMCKEGMVFKNDIFEIDAKAVGLLREKTGARLMDCKQALQGAKAEMEAKREEENRLRQAVTPEEIADILEQLAQIANDPNLTLVTHCPTLQFPIPMEESDLFQNAVLRLKAKNLATGEARKKIGTEGRISILEMPNGTVVGVCLSCETDFVARNDEFIAALDFVTAKSANGIYNGTQADAFEVDQRLNELSGKLGESIRISHATALDGKTTGFYLHHDYRQGALVSLESGSKDLARQIAMHCVFAKPKYDTRDDVPKKIVEAELALIGKRLVDDPKNAKKPKEILDKIADGQLKKFYSTCVILDQPFFKDNALTVGEFLEKNGAKLKFFELLEIGS